MRVWLNNCATMMPQRQCSSPAHFFGVERDERGCIVPQRGGRSYRSPLQRSGRGWRSPAAAGRTAGRPIVSYGFVRIAFVSVSRLCPYTVRSSYSKTRIMPCYAMFNRPPPPVRDVTSCVGAWSNYRAYVLTYGKVSSPTVHCWRCWISLSLDYGMVVSTYNYQEGYMKCKPD